MLLQPGARLGPYQVTAKIGEGGMGEVYRARDTKLDRDVALKVLPEAFTQDPDRLARFEREAKVLASLNHPNIGHIYGLEEADGIRALVLELVEGPTLADRIKEGPIPLDEALPIAKQIAEALEAAHEKGIIHRDLKPANIKVRDDGTVKVLDFGLAKAPQGDTFGDLAESPTITAMATATGVIIGTAAYMAPEQAKGKAVDKRADIWAFGAVLFEMLTGKRAFIGNDVSETLAAILRDDADVDALPVDTPVELRRVIRICLQRDRREWAHAIGDVRLVIEGAFEVRAPAGQQASVQDRPSPGMSWSLAAIAAAIGAVGAITIWTATRPSPDPPQVARFTINPTPDAPLAYYPRVSDFAISTDGRTIVYNGPSVEGSGSRLYLRPLDQLVGEPIEGGEQGLGPFLSPDGEWVGVFDESLQRLWQLSTGGGIPIQVVDSPSLITGATWTADDHIIFGGRGLGRVPSGGGEVEQLTTVDRDGGERHMWPFAIRDRDAVLFVIATGGVLASGELAVLDLRTREVRQLGVMGVSPRYLPTGHLVYATRDGSVYAAPFDAETLDLAGTALPLIGGVRLKASGGAADFSISDSGTLVYATGAAGGQRTLVWVDRDGQEELVDVPRRGYVYARLSPDGGHVALDVRDAEEGSDIWIWDFARGTLQPFTINPGRDRMIAWSPDGNRIAFHSQRNGSEGIYWQPADGSGRAEKLTEGSHAPTSFTPDGTRLIFLSPFTSFTFDLGAVSLQGEPQVEWLLREAYSEGNGEISPDGRWLAYQSDESGQNEIWVRSFPDVTAFRTQVSNDGGTRPLWSRDGTELFYFVDPDTIMTVPVGDGPEFVAGLPTVAVQGPYAIPSNAGRHYDVSCDGQRILLLRETGAAAVQQMHVVQNWFEELKRLVPVP